MKKYTIIERATDGTLNEKAYFAEKADEVKSLDGFVTITKTERVKHPSPEVMQRVLLDYQISKNPIDLAEFYAKCDAVADALNKSGEATTATEPTKEADKKKAKQE